MLIMCAMGSQGRGRPSAQVGIPRTSRSAIRRCAALGLVLSLGLAGCDNAEPDPPRVTTSTDASPSTTAEVTESPEAAPATSAAPTTYALPDLPDYALEITPDDSWIRTEPAPGTLTFTGQRNIKVISIHAVEELAGTAQEEVPEDVAAFLQEQRPDIVISDPVSITQSGLPAQRFRITMAEGQAPADLWTVVDGSGYKPLDTEPMEVVMIRSDAGLLMLWTEWSSRNQDATLAAFDQALQRITIG